MEQKNTIENKGIESVILIDSGINDTTLRYSAIVELNDQYIGKKDTCSTTLGIMISDISIDSLNEVYRSIYGCQRSFFLHEVNVREPIKQAGSQYYKIDFKAIKNYYSIPMMERLHQAFLSANLHIVLSENPKVLLVKGDSFKIKKYSYGFQKDDFFNEVR